MRRISLALALFGAIAAAGCSGNSLPGTSGSSKGTPGSTFTVRVRGDAYWVDGTTQVIRPQFGTITSDPPGLNCGPTTTSCEFDFAWGQPVQLFATGLAGYGYHLFVGDCMGLGECKLTGNADKFVGVRFSQTTSALGVHPNFSAATVHGPAFSNSATAPRIWNCKDCHGGELQGKGIAPGCGACHSAATVAALVNYYEQPAAAANTEQCAGCHTAGAVASVHAPSAAESVSASVVSPPAVVGSDIQFTINVKVNGVNSDLFTGKAALIANHNEDAWWVYDPAQAAGVRAKVTPSGNYTITAQGNGNYLISFTGVAALSTAGGISAASNGAAYMVSTQAPGTTMVATVVAYMGGTRANDVVGDQACMNCHGTFVWRAAAHDVTHPEGVGPCVVCHARTGSADARLPGLGSGLMGIVHGVHNSANMPDGQYTFTWTNGNKFNFSVGFPTYMTNCSVCHDSSARLAAVVNAPVSYGLCISCHDDLSQFSFPTQSHEFFTSQTACDDCHYTGSGLPTTVSEMHNGMVTERNGLIWNGEDVSVTEGQKINMAITGASFDPAFPNSLLVTWTATQSNVAVNPCNTSFANGPVFMGVSTANAATGLSTSNMSIIRMYAVGNDWVIGKSSTSPGQPASVNLTMSGTPGANGYTTCSANVATTTLAKESVTATRGILGLQGKPQIRYTATIGTAHEFIQVRAPSPVYEFAPATGAASTTTRRAIVSTAKCLKCHEGSLYQHGGNRVDSVELCVLCHNPASSEKQNRVAFGVDVTEAYDGKVGQTYDLRTMLHAIHSAGETGKLLVYYRSNGIYAFGSTASIATIPNWKTTANVTCQGVSEGRPAAISQYAIYGSVASGTVQVPTVAGPGSDISPDPTGACSTIDVAKLPAGFTKATYKTFNEIPVHYPRPLNDCGACHVDGFDALPSQATAVAVSDADTGAVGSASAIQNIADDVLTGVKVQSCFSCHQSSDPALDAAKKQHGYDYSWTPKAFSGGRGEVIQNAGGTP